MIPRTVLMAQEVALQLSGDSIERYGNIILNGYLSIEGNPTGKLAWQYQETTTPPVPLLTIANVRPALKGWTTNYSEYYTERVFNAYSVEPGDPTGFEYTVHSFTALTGPIASVGGDYNGSGYTPGTYIGEPVTTSGSGTGATLDIVVSPAGDVTSVTLNSPGADYAYGDTLVPVGIGAGTGLALFVNQVVPVGGGDPRWAQTPRRFFQNQVSPFVPPNANQQAIPYSFIYPVADNPTPPPIGVI